jgi:glycerol-3-phosphate dehydrogenase
MAEDVVDHAATLAGLEPRPCVTRGLNIHGFHPTAARFGELAHYGSDAPDVEVLIRSAPELGERLHPRLPTRAGEVVWAVREEMARTVDDVLSRRTRCLILDARAAREAAPRVAELLARELDRDESWRSEQLQAFGEIVQKHLPL